MDLTAKQKQFLKSEVHHLKPVVMIGNNGLTEGVIAEIELALRYHELIKVKIISEERTTKTLIAKTIARETQANLIQLIGSVAIFYRPSDAKKIQLPKNK